MANPQVEFLSASRELWFPFEAECSINPEVNKLFGDIYVSLPRSLVGNEDKLVLDHLVISSDSITAISLRMGSTSVLKYPENMVVSKLQSSWNATWRTVEFVAIADSSFNAYGVDARLVLNLPTCSELAGTSLNNIDLPLVSSCYDVTPDKITSVFVEPSYLLKEDVELAAGYNIKLDIQDAEEELRPRKRITISAIPGEGRGKSPTDCEDADENPLITLNGVTANEYGDIFINTDGCHWLYPLGGENPNIFMRNNCIPCVSCEAISETYCLVRGTWLSAQNTHDRLCQALNVYRDYVNLMDRFAKSLDTPVVNVKFERTDQEAYDVIMRLQVGGLAKVSSVTASFNYAPAAVLPGYRDFSGRRKLPGYAHQQIPAPFNGTYVTYPATIGEQPLDRHRYASWYWNMHFDRCDGTNSVSVTWVGEVTFEPGSGVPPMAFTGSISLGINPISCSL